MGCTQSSPIETAEVVSQCRHRKELMKGAVSSRNGFAVAHSSYATALKNTGAALTDYALTAATAADLPSDHNTLPPPRSPPGHRTPPPPPPPPNFAPLQRAVSMPDLPLPKRKAKKPPVGGEVIQEEDDGGGNDGRGRRDAAAMDSTIVPPPPLPPQRDQPSPPPQPADDKGKTAWEYFFFPESTSLGGEEEPRGDSAHRREEIQREIPTQSPLLSSPSSSSAAGGNIDSASPPTPRKDVNTDASPPATKKEQPKSVKKSKQEGPSVGVSEAKRGDAEGSSPATTIVSLTGMLIELDNHFLKAFESTSALSKMLEAARFHYHSNFVDNRGYIDHSARVKQVITWNKTSSKRMHGDRDRRDDFNEELETHATILDKLLAWEKKLYKEVKATELTKIDYQRKLAHLSKQKKRGVKSETLEKTKAVVSHSRTRYIVDMQSLDSTVSEIQHLRDHQLYPKLTIFLDEAAKMWEAMYIHHDSQQKIVMDIQYLDISSAPKETSSQLYDRTVQLQKTAVEWHSQFQNLVKHQKGYVQSLNGWLQLNIPTDNSLVEKSSSPPPQRPNKPPIQVLLHAWHKQIENLPVDKAKSALCSFAAIIDAIMVRQLEELKQKEIYESARNECSRKQEYFGYWLDKKNSRRKAAKEIEGDGSENHGRKEHTMHKELEVKNLMKRAEEEKDKYLNLRKQVREKSVASLKMQLPDLFRAMSDFSLTCATMCKNLQTIAKTQNQPTAS